MAASGFLDVLKPPSMTSHDVVDFVRRGAGGAKVGHLGTLDPMAAGVLPVAVGSATRLIRDLPPARKAYRAEVMFGIETDTLDAEGAVLSRSDPPALDRGGLQEVCNRFLGTIMQRPPRVSAIRVDGVRSYERARRGEEFELEERAATYQRIEVLRVEGERALLDVECSPGTYIRSLARDVGARLGCGAILSFLVRTRSGPFTLEEAVTLEELRDGGIEGSLWSVERTFERAAGVPP